MSEQAAKTIVTTLERAGFRAFFAGGAVRDHLLGRPAGDYDIATEAPPEEVMRLFPRHTAVGAHFGVVLVHLEGRHIEVATFRTDGSYLDGRHPDAVVYSRDPVEDVRRRDFTINGLFQNATTGEVLDWVNGRRDLEAGIVRTIGDPERRFAEDRLRMLRAIRFAARLGFRIDEATFEAIRSHAPEIVSISRERIRDELLKMLTEGRARRAFELLEESRLLACVLPEVAAMKGVEQPPQFHPEGDVWTHTLMMLEALPEGSSRELALGVLLHDVGKPPTFQRAPDRIRFNQHAPVGARMAAAIARRLRLSGEETRHVEELVENHMKFFDVPRMRESTFRRFLRLERFDDHMTLHRLDCTMSHGDLSLFQEVERRRAALPPEAVHPPRLITGNDLKLLGLPPGPLYGKILAELEDEQLEGRITTREAALAFAEKRRSSGC